MFNNPALLEFLQAFISLDLNYFFFEIFQVLSFSPYTLTQSI